VYFIFTAKTNFTPKKANKDGFDKEKVNFIRLKIGQDSGAQIHSHQTGLSIR
jgi:hypothetical protein